MPWRKLVWQSPHLSHVELFREAIPTGFTLILCNSCGIHTWALLYNKRQEPAWPLEQAPKTQLGSSVGVPGMVGGVSRGSGVLTSPPKATGVSSMLSACVQESATSCPAARPSSSVVLELLKAVSAQASEAEELTFRSRFLAGCPPVWAFHHTEGTRGDTESSLRSQEALSTNCLHWQIMPLKALYKLVILLGFRCEDNLLVKQTRDKHAASFAGSSRLHHRLLVIDLEVVNKSSFG